MAKNSNCNIDYYYSFRNMAWSENIIIGNIEAFFMNMVLLLLGFWKIYINIYEINMLILYVIPFIIGLIVFYIEYKKLRSRDKS